MDIEKEREAFNQWVVTHLDNFDITRYEEGIMFDAWIAAKQQAIPEWFVVVPIEPTDAMLDASRRRQWDDLSSPYEDMDMLKYKAMIQEVRK